MFAYDDAAEWMNGHRPLVYSMDDDSREHQPRVIYNTRVLCTIVYMAYKHMYGQIRHANHPFPSPTTHQLDSLWN